MSAHSASRKRRSFWASRCSLAIHSSWTIRGLWIPVPRAKLRGNLYLLRVQIQLFMAKKVTQCRKRATLLERGKKWVALTLMRNSNRCHVLSSSTQNFRGLRILPSWRKCASLTSSRRCQVRLRIVTLANNSWATKMDKRISLQRVRIRNLAFKGPQVIKDKD